MALNFQPNNHLSMFQRIQTQKQHIKQLTAWNKDLLLSIQVQDDIIDELRRENAELRAKRSKGYFEEQI